MFVRIEYVYKLGMAGHTHLDSNTYVMEFPDENRIRVVIRQLLSYGFVRRGDRMGCDEEMIIAPGAILSMVPCDKAGFSKYDLGRIGREQQEERK